MKGSLMLLCPYGEACFCVILLISFGIDGIPLLDSITVVSSTCSSPGKVKSAYRLGRNNRKPGPPLAKDNIHSPQLLKCSRAQP